MNTLEPRTGRLHDLDPDECWSLAASEQVGRLAWTGPSGPTVVPVNFGLTGRRIHVRTTAYSALARECDDSPVAFEIDSLDPGTKSGWSVLMRGHAHLEYGGADSSEEPDVWPSGPRTLRVSVDVESVSGRRIT